MSEKTYVIFTDSAADLPEAMMEHMGVECLPMNVFMKDNPALACTLRGAEFYEALKGGQVACTSAANLTVFRARFADVLRQGKDILYLAFSSALSCMYQTALIAAEELAAEFPDRKIAVVDTLCASMGEGLLVYHAAELRERGMSLDELTAYAEENKQRFIHWFTVDDLLFLKRGGRVGAVSAYAGTLLGIKPVLHVSAEGKLIPKQKVRGRRKSILELAAHYGAECKEREATVFISHANAPEDAELLKETLCREHGAKHVVIGDIGPVVGAHSGPGTVALFYIGETRG